MGRFRTDRDADIGIGTIILVITILIVAVVVGTERVAKNLQIQQITGDRNEDVRTVTKATIQVLHLYVSLKPGSPPIDLDAVSIQITFGGADKIADG